MRNPRGFPYKWVRLSADSSEIEIESFVDLQKRWRNKASQQEPCQVCPVRFTEHTHHYVIYQCNSPSCANASREMGVSPCSWFVRTTLCNVTKRGTIDQHGQHLSAALDDPLQALNFTMKRFIHDMVEAKFKPSRILNAMIDAGLVKTDAVKPKGPVTSYAYNSRTRGQGDNNNVDEMEWLLASRKYHADLPEDAAFSFAFPTNESGMPALSTGEKTPVVVGFATKHSIRNLGLAEHHPPHVDATFKLNTARFLSIVIGVSDTRRQFHPVAFFIVSNIQQPQLETAFRETFRLYRIVTGRSPTIAYTMADVDVAQRNAIEAVVAADLRSLVSVNAQAQAFLDMCHRRACRARPFATIPSLSAKQAGRFRALTRQGRLEVTSHYRSSFAFTLEGDRRRVLRVVQRGVDAPRREREKPLTANEELDGEDENMEVSEQPSIGWVVDVDAGTCECHNWRKFAYCVHLIAARIHEDLLVEGVKTKRTFAVQGRKQGQGRRGEVGPALALE